jgi:hypothetical protein
MDLFQARETKFLMRETVGKGKPLSPTPSPQAGREGTPWRTKGRALPLKYDKLKKFVPHPFFSNPCSSAFKLWLNVVRLVKTRAGELGLPCQNFLEMSPS